MYLSCMQIDINPDSSGELFLTTTNEVVKNGSLAYAVRAHEEDCMKLKVGWLIRSPLSTTTQPL